MKLVILGSAIIIAQAINHPNFIMENKINLILFCIAVGVWEAYDYYKNKKQ